MWIKSRHVQCIRSVVLVKYGNANINIIIKKYFPKMFVIYPQHVTAIVRTHTVLKLTANSLIFICLGREGLIHH